MDVGGDVTGAGNAAVAGEANLTHVATGEANDGVSATGGNVDVGVDGADGGNDVEVVESRHESGAAYATIITDALRKRKGGRKKISPYGACPALRRLARFSTKAPREAAAAMAAYRAKPTEQDWRRPEHRLELFLRYFAWRVTHEDLDQRHWMKQLTAGYDREQKLWYGLVFGMTYRSSQAWAYTETFPHIADLDLRALEEWHQKNWRRTTYGSDARYNKGHFVSQCASVKKWLAGGSLSSKIDSIINRDSQRANFYALFSEISSLHRFGRMTSWLAMQALYDVAGLPIDPGTPIIDGYGPHNDSSMGSIWNGLCALRDEPYRMVGKYGDYKPTSRDMAWFQEEIKDLSDLAAAYTGVPVDSYRCETIWCMFKRLFNGNASKEYAGHSSGDHAQWYGYYRDSWPEIDWRKYRKAARTLPGSICGKTIVPWHNSIFGETGLLVNMDDTYADLPDVYAVLGLDRREGVDDRFWTDDRIAADPVGKRVTLQPPSLR